MKALVILMAMAMVTVSCGSGQNSSYTDTTTVPVAMPQGPRTSSDMNISPPNLTTSDPAIKMQDTLTTQKPVDKQ